MIIKSCPECTYETGSVNAYCPNCKAELVEEERLEESDAGETEDIETPEDDEEVEGAPYECSYSDCDREFDTKQGRGVHESQGHSDEE